MNTTTIQNESPQNNYQQEVIINLAPTGMVPTRQMSPQVPLTVNEIVEQACRCIEIGANIVHLHARDETDKPTYKKAVYENIIAGIREKHSDVVLGVSLSGREFTTFAERSDVLELSGDLKPDLASLTLSSMNFASGPSVNAPDMIVQLAQKMLEVGIKPELEVFDLGMINMVEYLADKNLINPPYYLNLILGNLATAQVNPSHIAALVTSIPSESVWTVGGIGRAQRSANALGILHGNGARVGLEDNLWMDNERTLPATNEMLTSGVVKFAEWMGKTTATPKRVRQMLNLGS